MGALVEAVVRHPDEVWGAEEAGYLAGEMLWLRMIRRAGKGELARRIEDQQFRRDSEGNIFVELEGRRLGLGHVSEGYEILREQLANGGG